MRSVTSGTLQHAVVGGQAPAGGMSNEAHFITLPRTEVIKLTLGLQCHLLAVQASALDQHNMSFTQMHFNWTVCLRLFREVIEDGQPVNQLYRSTCNELSQIVSRHVTESQETTPESVNTVEEMIMALGAYKLNASWNNEKLVEYVFNYYDFHPDHRKFQLPAIIHGPHDVHAGVIKILEATSRLYKQIPRPRLRAFPVVPDQTVAPYKFGISDNTLIVLPQPPSLPLSHRATTEQAFEALVEMGDFLARDLTATNAGSLQLKDAYMRVQECLKSRQNHVKLGMFAGRLVAMVSAANNDGELSGSLLKSLIDQAEGIYDYLAQFAEWQEYIANAASARIDIETLKQLAAATHDVADRLRDARTGEIGITVSTEVTDALDNAAWSAVQNNRPNGQGAFGLATTLQNLLAAVLKPLGKDIADEVRPMVAKAVAVTIVSGLGLAISSLTHYPSAAWLGPFVATLQKEAKKMSEDESDDKDD